MWTCPYEGNCEIIEKKNEFKREADELLEKKKYFAYARKVLSKDGEVLEHKCSSNCRLYLNTKRIRYKNFLTSILWRDISFSMPKGHQKTIGANKS